MPRRVYLLVVLLFGLALVACGQSSSSPTAPTPPQLSPTPLPAGGFYPVVMRPQEPLVGPKAFSALAVPPGLAGLPLPHRASYLPGDLVKTGSAFEAAPPSVNVLPDGDQADFAPNWTSSASPLSDAAYALYKFSLDGYDQAATLQFGWATDGTGDYADFWVGLANQGTGAWDWFAGPPDDVLTIASYTPYMGGTGQVWLAVVFTGTTEWKLTSLTVGTPEVRAIGDEGLPPEPDPLIPPVDGALPLPDSVDLSPGCSPVNDQMTWTSCAAFAVGDGAYNYELGQIYGDLGWDFHNPFNLVSPKHLYVVSGELEGFPPDPLLFRYTGRVVADLVTHGVATEKNAPYNLVYDNNWSAEALADAALLNIEGWSAIPCNNDAGVFTLRAILALEQRPVIMRVNLDTAFLDYTSGVWNYAGPSIGGHAMLIVGYDQSRSAFKVRNSWSRFWGEDGYLWIGYDTFKSVTAQALCWTIRDEYDPAVAARFLGVVPQLPPPVNVNASDGTYGAGIRVDWTLVAGAVGYVIYRDAPDHVIGSASANPFYIDSAIADYATHTYWVQAFNGPVTSELSSPDTGYRGHAPEISDVAPQEGQIGQAVTFSATIGTGEPPFTYAWDFGGGAAPNTSSAASPAVTLGTQGNYSASLVVTNGAGSDTFNFTLKVKSYVTELLVVYNTNIPEDLDLAQYYMSPLTGRAIDAAYVLGLPLADAASFTQDIPRADYESQIRDPIKAFLNGNPAIKGNLKYILLMKGIPHKIQGINEFDYANSTCSSVDNELCCLYSDGTYPLGGQLWNEKGYQNFRQVPAANGFYLSDNQSFAASTFYVSDSGGGTYKLDYLVGRLDAYTYDEAKLLVDRSLAADTSGEGWIVFDSCAGRQDMDTMVDPVWPWSGNTHDSGYELLNAAGFNVFADITDTRIISTSVELPGGFVNSLIGYAGWGVNHTGGSYDHGDTYILDDLGWNYLPGACFMSYESFNGSNFDGNNIDARRGQGQIADFLRMGGTVAIGNAWEPFTVGVGDERWVFDRYIDHGDRWIEAAYKGLRLLSWQEVVVGDPLCTVVAP